MKRILLLTMAVLCVSSLASAQYNPGSIDIYSDVGQASCDFADGPGAIVRVYFYHTHTDGATASQWMLDLPASTSWMHFGDIWTVTTVIGSSIGGVSIGYGACQGSIGDFYLGSATFQAATLSEVCGLMSIVPDPVALSGLIEIIDCQGFPEKHTLAAAGQGRLNSDGSCNCSVPVQETTWGGIKALYN